jgi:uncharacterized membrane protein
MPDIVIFVHIMSAVLWIGGMIALRFAVHSAISGIDDGYLKLKTTLAILKSFFNIVKYLVFLLVLSAVIMVVAIDFTQSNLKVIVYIKEFLWSIMAIIFVYIYILRYKAEKYFLNNDIKNTKLMLKNIPKIWIPLNITLGIIAIYLGITLRGF